MIAALFAAVVIATHGVGDSNVARGSLDAVTLHQDGEPGAPCWLVMDRTRRIWSQGHADESWLMLCGANDAIAGIPTADSIFAIVKLRDELEARGGTLCYVTPQSLHTSSAWKAIVDDGISAIVDALPSDVCLIDAHAEWIARGHDERAELYEPDGGHLNDAGNAVYGEIVSQLVTPQPVPLSVDFPAAVIFAVIGWLSLPAVKTLQRSNTRCR